MRIDLIMVESLKLQISYHKQFFIDKAKKKSDWLNSLNFYNTKMDLLLLFVSVFFLCFKKTDNLMDSAMSVIDWN